MVSVSKVPNSANKYAIECAYKIRNKTVEYAKGLTFFRGDVVAESDFIKGKKGHIRYSMSLPKDVFVHNHPIEMVVSCTDLIRAIKMGTKKIFASTKSGYTAFDLTTVKSTVYKSEMIKWLKEIRPNRFKRMLNKLKYGAGVDEYYKNYYHAKMKEFAKFSGATFSDVKWSDYKQLRA